VHSRAQGEKEGTLAHSKGSKGYSLCLLDALMLSMKGTILRGEEVCSREKFGHSEPIFETDWALSL